MAKHEHGTMETGEQQNMFLGFVNFVKWTIIVIIVTLVFLAFVGG